MRSPQLNGSLTRLIDVPSLHELNNANDIAPELNENEEEEDEDDEEQVEKASLQTVSRSATSSAVSSLMDTTRTRRKVSGQGIAFFNNNSPVHPASSFSSPDSYSSRPESATTSSSTPLVDYQQIFDTLFVDYPLAVTRVASRNERKLNEYISTTLVYGEIAFDPFRRVIELLKRKHGLLVKPGGTFLDIGSGSGKGVFGALLSCHDFDACVGIEILEGLHQIASLIAQNWEKRIKKQFPAISMQKKRTRVAFHRGDALELDWPLNVDLLFMNSTCFGTKLMKSLTKKILSCCKSGTIIVTATYELVNTPIASGLIQQEALAGNNNSLTAAAISGSVPGTPSTPMLPSSSSSETRRRDSGSSPSSPVEARRAPTPSSPESGRHTSISGASGGSRAGTASGDPNSLAARARNGSFDVGSVVGFTQPFDLLQVLKVQQEAWGEATWFVYRKK